ncbi:MAG: class I SAM-dependent methyltransferase, partial [Verrucomicrobiota bacterium]|nr:class I SAM-dependent methyltransferase [Verrucomicrobiota bacterium]
VFAQERFEKAGFSDMIELRLQDYRDLEGQFDGIVSCEMIEAVGKEYLPSYFNTIRNCLRQGANAVLQAITINDDRYDHYCRSCDWIQKHIFPGGHLPSLGAVTDHVLAAGDTRVVYVYSFGHHYAETLRRWFSSFNNRLAQLKSLGFDEKFQRKWNYYLSYCEAGFDADLIDVKHIVINRS